MGAGQPVPYQKPESSYDAVLLDNPKKYREALLALIRGARSELLLEFFILEPDSFGQEILSAVQEATERGVQVKLLLDGFGSHRFVTREIESLRALPAEVRVYHPLPWSMMGLKHLRRLPRDWWTYLATCNRRNHRKLAIADHGKAIFGSHNLWEESLEWAELSVQLCDGQVGGAVESFANVWHRGTNLDGHRSKVPRKWLRPGRRTERPAGNGRFLDNTNVRRSRHRNRSILQEIRGAQERLWIATPYLCPHRTLLRAICERARAGVDVHLLLPSKIDFDFLQWYSQALYRDLLDCGVVLHEYRETVLHAKLMIIDDQYLIGSSNLNHRSFFQDLEIDHLGSDPGLLQALCSWSQRIRERSRQVKDICQVRGYWSKKVVAWLMNPFKVYF